jgi:Putative prokaryotic signal transducing protein
MRTCPNSACPDRVRLGLAGEYVDSVTVCPQCGTPLIDATPAAESPASSEALEGEIKMICVLRTADEGLASLVKSMFDGDGIRYVVRGEGLQDLLGWGRVGGFNYIVGPAEFLVHQDDADRARTLLQAEASSLADEPTESDDDPLTHG